MLVVCLSSRPVPSAGILPEPDVIERLKDIIKGEVDMVFPSLKEAAVQGDHSPLNRVSDHEKQQGKSREDRVPGYSPCYNSTDQ